MKIPFRGLDSQAWRRLAITAVATFYIALVGAEILQKPAFSMLGLDYLGFWSTGKIANEQGFSQVYELANLRQVQSDQLKELGLSIDQFSPVPVPFFSFFLLLFPLFSKLNAELSFWIWSILNLGILVGYLRFFVRKVANQHQSVSNLNSVILLVLISYPVFQNFYWGQIEVILVVCAGEFIRSSLKNKPVASGVWLAGMLIKPQVLILAVPALILMKNWKAFFGFACSAFAILAISLLISGLDGIMGLVNLLVSYVPGIATNVPEGMINWRMLGLHINYLTLSAFGWIVAGAGMIFSLMIWFFLSLMGKSQSSGQGIAAMCGIFATTLAFTWHSHIHMAMVLIPFLIYLFVNDYLSATVIDRWVFPPPAVSLSMYGVAILMVFGVLPFAGGFGAFPVGVTFLVLNTWVAVRMLNTVPLSHYLIQKKVIPYNPDKG